jgi:hypothetical protein
MGDRAVGTPLPAPAGLIAGTLVVVGLVLSQFVAEGLLVISALGAFGPGILRELGWLRDQDEFQRQAAHRAGYHAYLIGGFVAVVVVAVLRSGEGKLDGSSDWALLILLGLWMSWLVSALIGYWGGTKTARTVLLVFGSFWAVFVIADVASEPSLVGALMALVFAGPFFVLAATAGRWPRVTGATLLGVPLVFLAILQPWRAGGTSTATTLVALSLLLVPLVASGVALLRASGEARA